MLDRSDGMRESYGESTMSFKISDACEYGMPAAVLLKNIRHWLDKNTAEKSNYHRHAHTDGKIYYWTYNSASAFTKLFPFITRPTMSRILRKLEEDGVLISNRFNKRTSDATKWYTMPDYFTGETVIRTPPPPPPPVTKEVTVLDANAQNEQGNCVAQNEQGSAQNEQGPAQNEQALPDIKQTDIKQTDLKRKSLLLTLQARRGKNPSLFEKPDTDPLTPDEVKSIPVEWLREAVDYVRAAVPKNVPNAQKVAILNTYIPVMRMANSFLYGPGKVSQTGELERLWRRWRRGSKESSLPDTRFMGYCWMGSNIDDIGVVHWESVEGWLKWDKSAALSGLYDAYLNSADKEYEHEKAI